LHLDRVIEAPCRVLDLADSKHANKFRKAKTTINNGLGIDPTAAPRRINEALHRKVPVFNNARAAFKLIEELLEGSPYTDVLNVLRLRPSKQQPFPDGSEESLTLSMLSTSGKASRETRAEAKMKSVTVTKKLGDSAGQKVYGLEIVDRLEEVCKLGLIY
jgi:hypothetical protein